VNRSGRAYGNAVSSATVETDDSIECPFCEPPAYRGDRCQIERSPFIAMVFVEGLETFEAAIRQGDEDL
jgi:hypothetical protein